MLQEFDFKVKDQKGCEKQVANHLSRIVSNEEVTEENNCADAFPDEFFMMASNGALTWSTPITS